MRYLNKIIFINSARIQYAEIQIDGNVHFIGTQGVGKSTALRALLFFYNANKTKLLAEHRDQVFNEYLDSYLKEHQALFNDQAWEKLSISGYQGAASANFYTIYQQYFSEQQ